MNLRERMRLEKIEGDSLLNRPQQATNNKDLSAAEIDNLKEENTLKEVSTSPAE